MTTTVYIQEKEIHKRIKSLAVELNKKYDGEDIVIIGVLKGSIMFLSDLLKNLHIKCNIDFVTVSSYEGTESSGNIKLKQDITTNIENRNVLIIDDIIDTGLTMEFLVNLLQKRNPKSITTCVLLDKPSRRVNNYKVDYSAFTIPDKFVLGYGMDYDDYYRNIPSICVVEEE